MPGFTPIEAIAGGIMIGLSAGLVMILLGHIAGISGITEEVLPPWEEPEELPWRTGFLAGLIGGPLLWALFTGHLPPAEVRIPGPLMALAGLLVGFGTAYGHGCTSGHGICGLARLSPRSFVAVAVFMATGMLTVFVLRHMLGVGV
ncbi:MAG: YeeE/YedE family protein [Alphaproteobacteria bacterium]|nr:MAG: YeeE/YedE family protein [Alphaproteobacteria bacterium]